jgi:hypothetical protein
MHLATGVLVRDPAGVPKPASCRPSFYFVICRAVVGVG